jgi:hypothetical protein
MNLFLSSLPTFGARYRLAAQSQRGATPEARFRSGYTHAAQSQRGATPEARFRSGYTHAAQSQRGCTRHVHSSVSMMASAFRGRDDSLYSLYYTVKRLSSRCWRRPVLRSPHFLLHACCVRDTGGICCEIGGDDILGRIRALHVRWSQD